MGRRHREEGERAPRYVERRGETETGRGTKDFVCKRAPPAPSGTRSSGTRLCQKPGTPGTPSGYTPSQPLKGRRRRRRRLLRQLRRGTPSLVIVLVFRRLRLSASCAHPFFAKSPFAALVLQRPGERPQSQRATHSIPRKHGRRSRPSRPSRPSRARRRDSRPSTLPKDCQTRS